MVSAIFHVTFAIELKRAEIQGERRLAAVAARGAMSPRAGARPALVMRQLALVLLTWAPTCTAPLPKALDARLRHNNERRTDGAAVAGPGAAAGLDALFAEARSATVQGADLPMDGPAAILSSADVDSTFQCRRRAAGASHAGWPTAADLLLQPGARRVQPTAAYAAVRRHDEQIVGSAIGARSRQSYWNSSNISFHDKKRRAANLPQVLASYSRIAGELSSLLHQLVQLARPLISGETGFASGTSALAVLTALDKSATHVAIDPFQPAFENVGLRAVQEYTSAHMESAPRVAHLNETAAFGLAWLSRRAQCFDFFFMDDGHKFDDIMVELYTVSKLLSIGGLLLLHDTWMPSVKRAMSFISTNLPFLERMRTNARGTQLIAIYVKRHADKRDWRNFAEF